MKGYFSSLAKQSSVSIRGGRTSQARLPQAPRTETLAPLHSETVLFVDPTPATVRPVNDIQTPEKSSLQGISQHPPVPIEDPAISSQSRSTGRSLAAPALSNSTHRSRTGDTLGPVAPFENSFSMTNSPKVAIESPEKSEAPLVERPVGGGPTLEAEGHGESLIRGRGPSLRSVTGPLAALGIACEASRREDFTSKKNRGP